MVFTDYVSNILDNNEQVDVSYNDFAKAFDKVDHLILLNKLESFGFSYMLLLFFHNYLSNRKQYVVYGQFTSKLYATNSGVPQGSNLGPLLFLLFINDIGMFIRFVKFLLFADDIKLYTCITTNEDSIRLQIDIDGIVEWSHQNKLNFNSSKCTIMCITWAKRTLYFNYKMSGTSLKHISITKDLGIIFDTRLTFRTHIDSVCNSAMRMLGFVICNSKSFTNTAVIKMLYFTLVRSILESGSIIWGPEDTFYSNDVEKVQKKFMRYLYMREFGYYPLLYPSDFLAGMLGIERLDVRRNIAMVLVAHKLLNGHICNPDILERISFYVPDNFIRARQHRLFIFPRGRTNLPMIMPLGRITTLLNHISSVIDIFNLNQREFKTAISILFNKSG